MIKKQVPKLAFDKELFKRSVLYNIKTLYRKTLEEATPQQIFQAVSYAVKDTIVNNWRIHRRNMKRGMSRSYTICRWNF